MLPAEKKEWPKGALSTLLDLVMDDVVSDLLFSLLELDVPMLLLADPLEELLLLDDEVLDFEDDEEEELLLLLLPPPLLLLLLLLLEPPVLEDKLLDD